MYRLMLFIAAVLSAGCSHCPFAALPSTTVWPQAYQQAITDALNPEPDEQAYNLTAISADNSKLEWRNIDGTAHVKMASVTGNSSYYENSIGKSYNTGNYYTWVTAVPELHNLCKQDYFADPDINMRLRQLLGLTPTAKVTAVVEFWVPPEQLFRPTADYEIDDTHAGLIMPDNTPAWYRKWFNELRAKQYFQSETPRHDAYPWTQLGYTYDWGNPESIQGLSEFVIKSQADINVHGIYSIDEYCRKSAEKR